MTHLFQQPPPNAPEFGGSSPVGLAVILALFVVTFFLVRSMNKHLRKVPTSFDPEATSGTPSDPASPAAGAGQTPIAGIDDTDSPRTAT